MKIQAKEEITSFKNVCLEGANEAASQYRKGKQRPKTGLTGKFPFCNCNYNYNLVNVSVLSFDHPSQLLACLYVISDGNIISVFLDDLDGLQCHPNWI